MPQSKESAKSIVSQLQNSSPSSLSQEKSSQMIEMNVNHINSQSNNSPPPYSSEFDHSDEAQQSRFHVAKVNDDSNESLMHIGTLSGHSLSIDYTSTYYDTDNLKSLRYYTREALPRVDNYRNLLSIHGHMSRPTLDELHGVQTTIHPDSRKNKDRLIDPENVPSETAVKFGWIQGVLVRCLLNIWGVMLFLRLSWVVGQSGIGLSCVIILLATSVTTITSISMAAICTNGEVKGGGTYYMISRSLGPEFGGAIGIIFAIANAVAIAMYAVGFAESLIGLLSSYGINIIDGAIHDTRIISSATVCVLLCIAIIGTEWETKAQIVLLIILLTAMVDFIIGSLIPPSEEKTAKGYIGWSVSLIGDNFVPDFRDGHTFISVFSIFFPAATGMLAGANISGDLKDPQKAIPKGTFLAIIITTISYIIFAFISGAVNVRDSNGIIGYVHNYTNFEHYLTNCSLNLKDGCRYGLQNNMEVMKLVAAFGPIIYAGVFAATLSSALASLVSAPKVFQALCKDKLFPYIQMFGKGYGKNNEPRPGYLLAFGIALACCIIGELNAIAPIISNFFLAAYCLINFSCFHASFGKSPGFRPAYKYYNMWLSLCGSVLCLGVMFLMDWSTALLTFVIILALYVWVLYRKPDVNWGSSTQAQIYRSALNSVYRLNFLPEHVKNFRPQILVLSGKPSVRPPLVDFANSISKGIGLIICGHMNPGKISQRSRSSMNEEANNWLHQRKIKGFYNLIESDVISDGVKSMIESVGIGKLRPNFVLIGFKNNWQTSEPEDVIDYFTLIHNIFDKHLALGILRLQNGLDYSRYGRMSEILECMSENGMASGGGFLNASFVSVDLAKGDSNVDLNDDNYGGHLRGESLNSRESSPPSSPSSSRAINKETESISIHPSGIQQTKDIPKDVLLAVNQFQRKQKKGYIDVWWLYDDGGLTLLVPYLLTTRKQWNGCKLRVFSLANKKDELDTEQRNMAALLSKFRIDYSDVTVIPDIVKPPQESSRKAFKDLISKWKGKDDDSNDDGESLSGTNDKITDSELLALKDKTNRHLRLRELLCEHSRDASLIVMTLPMPRKGTCSAPLYMAWLETLTYNMPPFLLIRGNQTNVLTFYS